MYRDCVPYPRKRLYLVLNVPIMVIFTGIAILLSRAALPFFIIYCGMLIAVLFIQAYCCAYQECPYIGRFCPGIGGFLMISAHLARLFRHARKSEKLFNALATIGFSLFTAIIVLPVYHIFRLGILFFIGYILFLAVYVPVFLLRICPVCAIRDTCPAGKVSGKLTGT